MNYPPMPKVAAPADHFIDEGQGAEALQQPTES